MSEAGSLSKYTPSADEMGRALAYWGHMTRENARAAVNRRIDFIKAAAWDEGFNKGTAHGIAYQAGNDEVWKRPANPYRFESEARP